MKGGAVLDENAQTYYPSSGKSLSKAVLEKDAELRSNPGYGQVQYSVLTTINLEGNATVDTSYGNGRSCGQVESAASQGTGGA